MNRPFINMELGFLKKFRSGQKRATTVLRNTVVLLLVFAQLFGLGIGQGLAANGQSRRPGGAAAPPAPPQAGAFPPSAQAGLVSLNFTGADLVEVIHVLAQYLKLNYTIDPGVRGAVTLYSAQPLRQQDLLPVFHQVLRMNDAVAVKSGEFYHIAPINAGKGMVRPARRLGERGYILQVVPVRFFAVSEIKRLLEPFITPGGEIIEYPRGNFLIILDLATNIQRLLEIKDLIDVNVFAGVRMELYQPKVASAEELADEMDRIMQAYAASAAQSENFVAKFIPVPRINRLLVISHSEAAWSYAMRWLERIDTYAEGPGRRIFVYPVENGKAVDLADILNQVLGQGPTGTGAPRKTLKDVAERIAGGQQQTPSGGATPAGQTGTGTGQSGSLYAVAPTQAPPPQTRPRPAAGAAPTSGDGGGADEQVRIVPDPATNSLIIFGTAQEFQNIRNILKEIDIVPRQVLMDVMIAEVTLSDDLRFGVEYQILRDDEVEIFGRDFDQHVSLLSGLPGALPGGAGPQALSAVIGTGDTIRGFINARREDSRVKVLSSPTILATDNQPARIQVGTEEPIATGTVTSPVSTGVTSSTTIQYRNTGRILTIIPQVNAQGLVNLQVKTEVSQRGASVTVGQDSFPSFDTRDAETTAVVQDGETLAIGGIITERVNRGRVGIPFLMDIPVFGRFFGTTTDDVDRTELIMLITPHVIRSKEEARTVTEEFKDVLSHVVREYGWEIENMQRQKRRGEEQQPQPQSAPTVEPQSSIVPPQKEPQKSARKATIVVPADQQAYESLSSKFESSTPAEQLHVPGQKVEETSGSGQQGHVVVLGNKGIQKGPELAMGKVQPDQKAAPATTSQGPYAGTGKTHSADRKVTAPGKGKSFTDELLSAVMRDLEQKKKSKYDETLSPGNKKSFREAYLPDWAAGEKVPLSTPEPMEPSSKDALSTSLLRERRAPKPTNPIVEETLRKDSGSQYKTSSGAQTGVSRAAQQDAYKTTLQPKVSQGPVQPKAAIPSQAEPKVAQDKERLPFPIKVQFSGPVHVSGDLSSGDFISEPHGVDQNLGSMPSHSLTAEITKPVGKTSVSKEPISEEIRKEKSKKKGEKHTRSDKKAKSVTLNPKQSVKNLDVAKLDDQPKKKTSAGKSVVRAPSESVPRAAITKKRPSEVVRKKQVNRKAEVKVNSSERDASKAVVKRSGSEISTEKAVLDATRKPTKISQQKRQASKEATEDSVPTKKPSSKVGVASTIVTEKETQSKQASWSLGRWFSGVAGSVTSNQKEPERSPQGLREISKVGTSAVSDKDTVSSAVIEKPSSSEKATRSALGDAAVPAQAESVTTVTLPGKPLSEGLEKTHGEESIKTNSGVSEEYLSETMAQGRVPEPTMRGDAPKAPVITNETLERFSQEAKPVTESVTPTETSSLEKELAGSAVPTKGSPSKETSWFPLGWWSQSETVTSSQDKKRASPEKPIELAQAEQPAVETLNQQPGLSSSAQKVPLTEELATTDSGKTKSQSKTSWSPLSWFSRTQPVTSSQEKTGKRSEKSIELSQLEQAAREMSAHEEVASSAVGGEPTTLSEPTSVGQNWRATEGIRFQRKRDTQKHESSSGTRFENSAVEEKSLVAEQSDPLVDERLSSVINSATIPEIEQTDKTPEVVSLVLPLDKDAEKALRATPIEPVESPFSSEKLPPIQKRVVREPGPVLADTESYLEGATTSAKTRSAAQRTEPRRTSMERTTRLAARQDIQTATTGRRAVWSVQVNAFSRERHAYALASKLQRSGYDAYVTKARVKGRYWYRVRVGRFSNAREAKRILARLKRNKTYRQAYLVAIR